MRNLKEIIIHCTATYGKNEEITVADIDRWHRQRGFSCIGYHFVIHQDGLVYAGRNINMIGAHCKGHNANSIGIAYIGGCNGYGIPEDTRTWDQKQAMQDLIIGLIWEHGHLEVHGHHFYNPSKACPCFDVEKEFAFINNHEY